MGEIGLGGLQPFVELVSLHHKRYQRFTCLRIFRVAHRQEGHSFTQFRRLSDRPDWPIGVIHILRDVPLGRVAFRGNVD